jgi:hypothetical protein
LILISSGRYYWRWLTGFRGPGTAGLPNLFDHGFQLQTSAMLMPKAVQLYAGGSIRVWPIWETVGCPSRHKSVPEKKQGCSVEQ